MDRNEDGLHAEECRQFCTKAKFSTREAVLKDAGLFEAAFRGRSTFFKSYCTQLCSRLWVVNLRAEKAGSPRTHRSIAGAGLSEARLHSEIHYSAGRYLVSAGFRPRVIRGFTR